MRSILVLLVLPLVTGSALAADGVLEINQTCAVQTGCFAGDTPGFPVTITSEGSYLLTGDLELDFTYPIGGFVIEMTAEASLDLGGFGINTVVGAGVRGLAPSEIKNGSVTNRGGLGGGRSMIRLAAGSSVHNVQVLNGPEDGGGAGLSCGGRCLITNVQISATDGFPAVECGGACVISDATISALGNGALALFCGSGCVFTRIRVTNGNTVAGSRTQLLESAISPGSGGSLEPLKIGSQSIIDGSTIFVYQPDLQLPPTCGEGCIISGSTFSGVATGETTPLIIVGTGSMIRRSKFQNSAGFGFQATGVVGYADNIITDNNGGNANPQVQGGTDLGGNLCGTRPTCP